MIMNTSSGPPPLSFSIHFKRVSSHMGCFKQRVSSWRSPKQSWGTIKSWRKTWTWYDYIKKIKFW